MIFAVVLSFSLLLFVFLIIGILALYIFFKNEYRYWDEKNVPHPKPSFPLGNLKWKKGETSLSLFKKFYEDSKHERYYGLWFLQKPTLMVNDLDLINRILIKNFDDFSSHETYFGPEGDPMSVTLFTLNGGAHRDLQANLAPIFTSLKLQKMVPNINKCIMALQEVLMERAKANEVIDVKDVMTRFLIDATYYALFGVDINFIKDTKSLIGTATLKTTECSLTMIMTIFTSFFVPSLAKLLKLPIISKKLFKFFNDFFTEIVNNRKANDIVKNDALQSLIELLSKGHIDSMTEQKESNEKQRQIFTVEHLTAQALTFLLGSYLSGLGRMPFMFYEFARNPNIQQKLRTEIKTVLAKYDGDVTFEALSEMEYLQQVIDETLRKYPAMAVMVRTCVNDFQIPDSSLTIKKGTYVIIPAYGLHMDEKYFPNPEKFDPDRFTPEKKKLIPNCAYLPFGKGPRICIGQNFGLMLLKAGVIAILSKFRIDMSEEYSPKEIEFDPISPLLTPKGKMLLKISLADQ